jgi:hypothetical protein
MIDKVNDDDQIREFKKRGIGESRSFFLFFINWRAFRFEKLEIGGSFIFVFGVWCLVFGV